MDRVMALDPSIILQAGRGVTPLLSPAEIQDQQMQREIGGMKLSQLRQGMQDDATQREIARSTAPDGLASAYYKAGLVKPAQEAQKFQVDQQKAAREAEKAKYETALKQYEIVGQVLGTVRDQASYDAGRQQLQAMGIPTRRSNTTRTWFSNSSSRQCPPRIRSRRSGRSWNTPLRTPTRS
jgi:hypothetical protein